MLKHKKRVIHKASSGGAKKTNYTCEDENLAWNIVPYLNDEITAKKCVQGILYYMAYHPHRQIKENCEIFEPLEGLLETATWKTEYDASCGDYNPHRPEPWLRCIHSIFGNMLFYMDEAERQLSEEGAEITPENIAERAGTYINYIDVEICRNRKEIETKEAQLKSQINSGDFTPKEALMMVKDNWQYLYPYQSTYEAIEYCVAASENHAKPKYLDAALRDLGQNLSAIYQNEK